MSATRPGAATSQGPLPQHVVVTVHGIRTFGKWQQRLARLLRARDPLIHVENFNFNYFSLFAFLIPPIRGLVVARFRRAILNVRRRFPEARLDLVGHSFGTHLIGWALLRTPPARRPRVHTVLLSGSVLRSGFPWADLLEQGYVQRIVNDCGTADSVLLLSQLFVLFTGMAGRIGFAGLTTDQFLNRFFRGGHSHYFGRRGSRTDLFMTVYWLPLLLRDDPVRYVDQRPPLTVTRGLVQALLQSTEPIKLTIYAIVLLTPAWIYFTLYREAESRRLAAECELSLSTLSRELAAGGPEIAYSHLDLALLLAAEAHRVSPTIESQRALLAGLRYSPNLEVALRCPEGPVSAIAWTARRPVSSCGLRPKGRSCVASDLLGRASARTA